MPPTPIISPELKSAMDALRAGIEGAAPLSELQEAANARSMRST